MGRRLPGASHATPRAVKEVRVVTTGDEISLNYHSVGLGSAACHAAADWAGACSAPVAVAATAPLAGSGRGSCGGGGELISPFQTTPAGSVRTVPRGRLGVGSRGGKAQNATCMVRGLGSMSKPAFKAHTENYLCQLVFSTAQ